MTPVSVKTGASPLILAMPHTGTFVPDDIWERLNETGRALADTDWHVDRLYEGLVPDATIVRANFHRYVIDANRDPSGASLYPGQNTTGLCPLTDFEGADIYQPGARPDEAETEARRAACHTPYHAALQSEIDRLLALHGVVILYDCHSIRSEVPYLFEGRLPDFNIGTNQGATCNPEIEQRVQHICASACGYSSVTNGRFKGGWTTRHYGQPDKGVHAIQMELSQSTYLESETAPFRYAAHKADRLRPHLAKILTSLTGWAYDISENEACK